MCKCDNDYVFTWARGLRWIANKMKVMVHVQPGGENTLRYIRKGATVEVACRILDIDPTGYKIQVNGKPAELTKVLHTGDQLCLLKPTVVN